MIEQNDVEKTHVNMFPHRETLKTPPMFLQNSRLIKRFRVYTK